MRKKRTIKKIDFSNNPFTNSYVLHLNTNTKKKQFLNYIKKLIDSDKDFYAKTIQIMSLCSCIKIDGVETHNGAEHPFYLDRLL